MEQKYSSVSTRFVLAYATQMDPILTVKKKDGTLAPLDIERMRQTLSWAARGYEASIDISRILDETIRNMYPEMPCHEVAEAFILGASAFIEQDPSYSSLASRLLFKKLFKEVTDQSVQHAEHHRLYQKSFNKAMTEGVQSGLYDERIKEFDLDFLARHLCPERDELIGYMGLRTLYERYFTKLDEKRIELPQTFWMRIAMGLSFNEPNKNERAVEFYEVMSQLHYIPSTPTLLHASLTRPQLSSCFLTTVEDDLEHIFKCLSDNAQLSKWSGGVANDWTNIRAVGAQIKSIKTESQGVIPFLKINNAVTAAINRSGKRRAATVVYLETWHLEVEDFLDLRKNTGDERRRAHDINTAHWVPDLFMKRVLADGEWTLFSPHDVPDLHHIYGKEFEKRYTFYEEKARRGELDLYKVVSATSLWRKMLSRLFETGHPWITFKDVCNIRSPQDHVGVVHSSNLCTEITLNTSPEEVAVCNLGSINLARMVDEGRLQPERLAKTVKTAVRMLDNIIDINFYPIKETANSNLKHRPVGLGVMGLQDALYQCDIAFNTQEALDFADESMENIAYHAILASSELAQERGHYQSYPGSKWDRGLFPQDTLALVEAERGIQLDKAGSSERLDWTPVRQSVKAYGMRNSNVMAIAPTATISTIAGTVPSIEPIYKNIYVKANMSGEFTVVNSYLVHDLKKLGLWDAHMLELLKYYDGQVQKIEGIPPHLKAKYQEAFDIDPLWLLTFTAARGRWIDQSQAHNVFMKGVSGKQLHEIYMTAWKLGLKTTYYLRTLGASQIEKSTLDAKKFGFTQKRDYTPALEITSVKVEYTVEEAAKACSLESDPDCESCQ